MCRCQQIRRQQFFINGLPNDADLRAPTVAAPRIVPVNSVSDRFSELGCTRTDRVHELRSRTDG